MRKTFESISQERKRSESKEQKSYLPKVGFHNDQIEYYMETLDRKTQIKNLEERNRNLQIELAKLKTKAQDRYSRSRSRDVAKEIEGLCDEIQENVFENSREYAEVGAPD